MHWYIWTGRSIAPVNSPSPSFFFLPHFSYSYDMKGLGQGPKVVFPGLVRMNMVPGSVKGAGRPRRELTVNAYCVTLCQQLPCVLAFDLSGSPEGRHHPTVTSRRQVLEGVSNRLASLDHIGGSVFLGHILNHKH